MLFLQFVGIFIYFKFLSSQIFACSLQTTQTKNRCTWSRNFPNRFRLRVSVTYVIFVVFFLSTSTRFRYRHERTRRGKRDNFYTGARRGTKDGMQYSVVYPRDTGSVGKSWEIFSSKIAAFPPMAFKNVWPSI